MYEIERVLMDNDQTIEEEYLDENEHSSEEPPKKKTPIIRRPGEVVTPIPNHRTGTVKVSPSVYAPSPTTPRVTPSGRVKNTWQRVAPYGIDVQVKPPVIRSAPVKQTPPAKRVQQVTENNDNDDSAADNDDDRNGFNAVYSRIKSEPSLPLSTSIVTLETLDAKLDALDEKLNRIVAKLGAHDGALKTVKNNIIDLRSELATVRSGTTGYKTEFPPHAEQTKARPLKRQPQITLPIADDNYLFRLEELVQSDNAIREELFERFLEANGKSVFAYMRKNVGYLFNNTSKYTWTGRPSNSHKDAGPSGVASQLTLVDVLIDSGCEKFAGCSREEMEREFRRSLQRFNDAKFFKRRKRVLEQLAAAAARDAQEDEEEEEEEGGDGGEH
ncbi:conserved hypothetical protein [Culex quinquefasciatus]|uniref:DUF4806 domain-containing protein n=1 Tax=Culex quinquefasciatus TaxID=7176 RepID=B0WPZ8_CULQU|nr:conserved hypothetical protein [Culex quinquefasciatus]|eukprot:XP_001850782.1 conserved hypothetical protein [Culex quinquefasciatus]